MPVRSLSSSVLKWPDAATVREALTRWGAQVARHRPDLRRLGYIGSYARGDWGVGSDVDVIIVVEDSSVPFERRAAEWDTASLPVPADLLIYTEREWESLPSDSKFARTVREEARWLVPAD